MRIAPRSFISAGSLGSKTGDRLCRCRASARCGGPPLISHPPCGRRRLTASPSGEAKPRGGDGETASPERERGTAGHLTQGQRWRRFFMAIIMCKHITTNEISSQSSALRERRMPGLAAARSGAALTNVRARPCKGPSRTECLRQPIHYRSPASQPLSGEPDAGRGRKKRLETRPCFAAQGETPSAFFCR